MCPLSTILKRLLVYHGNLIVFSITWEGIPPKTEFFPHVPGFGRVGSVKLSSPSIVGLQRNDSDSNNNNNNKHYPTPCCAQDTLWCVARHESHADSCQKQTGRKKQAAFGSIKTSPSSTPISPVIINTSYQKLPFGSGDDPDKLCFHQARN